jgi:hypothetical protein
VVRLQKLDASQLDRLYLRLLEGDDKTEKPRKPSSANTVRAIAESTRAGRNSWRGVRGELLFAYPKSDAGHRTIPLDKETLEAFQEHRQRQKVERAIFGDEYQDNDLV